MNDGGNQVVYREQSAEPVTVVLVDEVEMAWRKKGARCFSKKATSLILLEKKMGRVPSAGT